MFFLILMLCPTLIVAEPSGQRNISFLSDKYINELNSIQSSWKAGRNFDLGTSEESVILLLGELNPEGLETAVDKRPIKTKDPEWPTSDSSIPKTFDARVKWRKTCPRISEVWDQGKCGSCWAVASGSAVTDRHCISSKGKFKNRLSAQHVAFCCDPCGYGCNGGFSAEAWIFFKKHGIVSGGAHNSSEGCQPYSLEPCHHLVKETGPYPKCRSLPSYDPVCAKRCTNDDYNTPFRKDRRRNKNSYVLPDERSIQKDIMTHGPISLSFKVYSDFPHYKSGVYEKTSDARLLGGHAVKVIGWGSENGVPYWLIMNSWNEYWGDKGLFKIKRGSNHCGIEANANGGVPRKYK